MKKAGLVTLCDLSLNYGNKLQNYAIIKIMESFSVKTITLISEPQYSHKDIFKITCKKIITKISYNYYEKYGCIEDKILNFRKFDGKYLNFSSDLLNGKLKINEFDYFLIGSDQVWNPLWWDELKSEVFLLTFAEPQQKICISPSFGIKEIPEKWEQHFIKRLKTFYNLSVREKSGADIIKKLTGKNAEVLIDPTLMLDARAWDKIAKKPQGVNTESPYILTYFLSQRPKQVEEHLKNINEERNYNIYHLLDNSQPDIYRSGPREFVYLISHAKLVLTDSFHACVFSFIFNKPFEVYSREGDKKNMNSRIETFLHKFKLERKFVGEYFPENVFECNYSEGQKLLLLEREKFLQFLKHEMSYSQVETKFDTKKY